MTQPVPLFTPYSTARSLFGPRETFLSALEAERIQAYQVYEQIYWNVPETFKLVLRGSQSNPIYIPTGRTIIDTIDRYCGKDFGFRVEAGTGPDTEVSAAQLAFDSLFRRERFLSKFAANKLFGLIRGDWCWHILADPAKAEGSRISIFALDPASFFKITHPNDVDRVIGVDIIEKIVDDDKIKLKVQRYTKGPDIIADPDDQSGLIYSSLAIWELDSWGDPKKGPAAVLNPPTALPKEITALPVYHILNFETPGDPYGSSDLRGMEVVMAAVNQSVTDENLALALEGLGVYWTDSGPPRDETTGKPVNWKLGPGRVIEMKSGTSFNRVTGVRDLTPYQDHLKFMINALKEATAATDAASGKVDVQVAESGISLVLQLGPMLAKAEKKDQIIRDVHTQMFHDLKAWLAAYERISLPNIELLPTFGQKIPTHRPGEVQVILNIVGVMPALTGWAVRQLQELGYDFTPEEIAAAAAATDVTGTRIVQELSLSNGQEPAEIAAAGV